MCVRDKACYRQLTATSLATLESERRRAVGSGSSRIVRFGTFEADFESGELRKGGVKIRLQEQPFKMLKALLEKPGRVVTREELQERLWPDDTYVDFEDGLSTAARKIRQALGDSARNPRYIETLPGRGYRFLGPTDHPGTAPPREETGVQPPAKVRWREQVSWAVAAGLALAAFSAVYVRKDSSPLPLRKFGIIPPVEVRANPYSASSVISPDGRKVAFVEEGADGRLWIQRLDQERPQAVEGTSGASMPFWSPDSNLVGFVADGQLKKVSLEGDAPVRVCELSAILFGGASWSPDGQTIVLAAGAPSSLFAVAAGGGRSGRASA